MEKLVVLEFNLIFFCNKQSEAKIDKKKKLYPVKNIYLKNNKNIKYLMPINSSKSIEIFLKNVV